MVDCIMLDIGGTFVKIGAVENGTFLQSGLFAINEAGSKEEILTPILAHLHQTPSKHIAISMPGPMEYSTGTPQMRHKFASLYGISMGEIFHREFPQREVHFVHDGVAFMLGEAVSGVARNARCACGIMLGTGLGFALWQEGQVLVRPSLTPAMPLWNMPYKNGIAEDFVSGRGMRRRWQEKTGLRQDVKEIADLARSGNTDAISLMYDTGKFLGQMLNCHLCDREIELIVLGGQISKSFDLMIDGFMSCCSIPVKTAEHIEDAALRGAWIYAKEDITRLKIIGEA